MNNNQRPMLSMRQLVQVVGKLDTIQHRKRRFKLLLDNEQKVPCLLVEGNITSLAPLFGKRVFISGMGVWQPSGRIERVEVDRVFPEEEVPGHGGWLPIPCSPSDLPLEEPTPRPWGLAAIIGKWPGDETDEQIEEALKRIS